jgi:hypothetical protein
MLDMSLYGTSPIFTEVLILKPQIEERKANFASALEDVGSDGVLTSDEEVVLAESLNDLMMYEEFDLMLSNDLVDDIFNPFAPNADEFEAFLNMMVKNDGEPRLLADFYQEQDESSPLDLAEEFPPVFGEE